MDALMNYLHMDGYAMFVWPAYALVTIGLVGVLWQSLHSWRRAQAEFDDIKSSRAED